MCCGESAWIIRPFRRLKVSNIGDDINKSICFRKAVKSGLNTSNIYHHCTQNILSYYMLLNNTEVTVLQNSNCHFSSVWVRKFVPQFKAAVKKISAL
jgi:hypothetical protein